MRLTQAFGRVRFLAALYLTAAFPVSWHVCAPTTGQIGSPQLQEHITPQRHGAALEREAVRRVKRGQGGKMSEARQPTVRYVVNKMLSSEADER